MKLIQKGHGPSRNVFAAWFCDLILPEIAKMLPSAMVVSMVGSKEPLTRAQLEALARGDGAELGETALMGWSAGCHGVRNALASVHPDFTFPLDGTHASIPQPGGMPIQPWHDEVARARRGESRFVASHIYNTYVELLKPPDGPYESTVTVLRKITGWDLPEPPAANPPRPLIRIEGNVAVYSYQSSAADGAAHRHQVRVVGPELVRQWLSLRWAGGPPVAAPSPPTPPAGHQGATQPAHGLRCSVAELYRDALALGTWHPAGDGYDPQPGDLLISARSGGDPTKGGEGHVEIVSVGEREAIGRIWPQTIGGNESNTWIEAPFDLRGADYRGCIERGDAGRRALEFARVELRAKVAEVVGAKHNPRIQEYHACARRGGSALAGLSGHEAEGSTVLGKNAPDEVPWCASAASWCYREALG